MKNLTAQAVYNADIYLRLSDDDGDKPESNSIKNQREFITEFLKSSASMPRGRMTGLVALIFFVLGFRKSYRMCVPAQSTASW